MNANPQPRILMPSDREAVLALAKSALDKRHADPMEREMQAWDARWRAEALDHYLALGWSFGVFQGENLLGFLLAQPLVFFRGLTQTLWVEHIEADDDPTEAVLLQSAVSWARDKHLQCVLCEGDKGDLIEIKTARYK